MLIYPLHFFPTVAILSSLISHSILGSKIEKISVNRTLLASFMEVMEDGQFLVRISTLALKSKGSVE